MLLTLEQSGLLAILNRNMTFFDVLWIAPLVLLGSGLLITLRQKKSNSKLDLEQKEEPDVIQLQRISSLPRNLLLKQCLTLTQPLYKLLRLTRYDEPNEANTTPEEALSLSGAAMGKEPATKAELDEHPSAMIVTTDIEPDTAMKTDIDAAMNPVTDADVVNIVTDPVTADVIDTSWSSSLPDAATANTNLAALTTASVADSNFTPMPTPTSFQPATIPVDFPATHLSPEAFQQAFTEDYCDPIQKRNYLQRRLALLGRSQLTFGSVPISKPTCLTWELLSQSIKVYKH
jgi:hypothetical protein